MSARGFKSVVMVGVVAGAALGCYLVSLGVASERAELESVESHILLAQRDIRGLETEIGTRGRLAQLERWNVKVIQLSAPSADQFVEGGFQLATLVKPEARPAITAPVVLAAAPAPQAPARPIVTNDDDSADGATPSRSLGEMMHVASYARPALPQVREATRLPAPSLPTVRPTVKSPDKAVSAKTEAAPVKKAATTKPVKTAMADPLAPLPKTAGKTKTAAAAKPAPSKESGSH